MNIYEFTVAYQKEQEGGKPKKVRETYLVDSLSYTEAEARATEKITEMMSKSFKIGKISTVNYSDVFDDTEGDYFYKIKVAMLYDDENGKQKVDNTYILIKGDSIADAIDKALVKYSDSLAEYEFISVSKSPIKEFFRYE